MPMNHLTSDLPEPFWLTKQHHIMESSNNTSYNLTTTTSSTAIRAPNSQFYHHPATAAMFGSQQTTYSFNLNNNNEDEEESDKQQNRSTKEEQQEVVIMAKEPLFEKLLTPSDVGKLNRLVIPKQHAEKYFPLAGQDSGGGAEKGLLLSFEDECGKPWWFRYSYWNSSQSYVLTKGWSRFVKEKRLEAGDVVLFERHRMDIDRLFIGWRRRSSAAVQDGGGGVAQPGTVSGGGGWAQVWQPYPPPAAAAIPYQPNCLRAGSSSGEQSQTAPSGNSKRSLRLFGVNLECEPNESEPTTPDCSTTSCQSQPGQHHSFQYYVNTNASYNNHYNHMDMNVSRDVNQMRYRKGQDPLDQ